MGMRRKRQVVRSMASKLQAVRSVGSSVGMPTEQLQNGRHVRSHKLAPLVLERKGLKQSGHQM